MAVLTVGVSGSRDYPRLDLVRLRVRVRCELHGIQGVSFLHGNARGVDRIAGAAAAEVGALVEALPVPNEDWKRLGKQAGHMRNVRLVEASDELDAFWTLASAGTADAVEIALGRGIPVRVWGPRGEHIEPLRCVIWLDLNRPHRKGPP